MRFVDTSFWVALQLVRDDRHQAAVALWRERDRAALLTTNHVIGETWTFLHRRAGHRAAVAFVDAAQQSPTLTVEHAGRELEAAAVRWLRTHDEREYSFVDAVSFEVMRRRRIADALAFDGDFAAAGFHEVRPR